MTVCGMCGEAAVYKNPTLCREHFFEYVEEEVKNTIDDYDLLEPSDRVAVACSGGKDSCTLLYLLKKFHGDVVAVAIDEGIRGYRDGSLEHLKEFCGEHGVELQLFSFEEAFGKPLDDMDWESVGGMPCTTCGTLRRYLLNKSTSGFDKVAVGHNLDDEAQGVLMNLFRANIDLMKRQGPKTGDAEGFTPRIKPLYFLKEKEVATYAYLKGFVDGFVECPNAKLSYRIWLRDLLNEYESKNPGAKKNLIEQQLKISGTGSSGAPRRCEECGEPSSQKVCRSCGIRARI